MAQPEYKKYLASEKWRLRVRRAALLDAGGKCERCGRRAEHVHHLTYERLGAERPEDTQALCARCHMEAHGKDWPPVVSTHTEIRDGKPFTVKVLPSAPEPPDTWDRRTTHRRRKRNIRK